MTRHLISCIHPVGVLQKAIQEARLFLNEGSLSEGMTVRPPDPDPAEEEESTNKPPESKLPKVNVRSFHSVDYTCNCMRLGTCM